MNINHLVETLTKEISSQSIMNIVSRISQFHRIQGSRGYLEAAQFIQSTLDENGLKTTLYEFPADGTWNHWGWVAPISWDIISGECWLIEPVKKRLCTYQNVPMSVITHSKACDFEASIVDVGKGEKAEDYKEATGKVALITGSPRNIFHLAAQHGVKGLIIHPSLERVADLGANTVQYDGFWPVSESLSKVTSGFSISHRQVLELKRYLETNEEVLVHFNIDAKFSVNEGKLHVLEVEIKGSKSPAEEVVLIAHLCHPSSGANDNASGSAALAEIVLILNRLITIGDLPHPERTLRFLWVPEFSGTIPWLKLYDDQRNRRKIFAAFNLDMVGESPVKIGTPLTINCPSCATPSYLKALLKNIAEYVSKSNAVYDASGRFYQLNYRLAPFAGGSDHLIFNDKHFSIPSVMLGHEDPFHHSSADSIDKVDPLECKSAAIIASSAAFSLSIVDNQLSKEILAFVFLDELAEAVQHEQTLDKTGLSENQKVKQTNLLEQLILKRLKSILELNPEGDFGDDLHFFTQAIQTYFSHVISKLKSIPENQKDIVKMRIKRNYIGPIPFKRLMRTGRSDEDVKTFLALSKEYWGGVPLELLNLASGSFTFEEIFLLLKIQYPNIDFNSMISLIKLFQKEKILEA
ncbi:MAG: DUF4910 domain-containing protein [Candidatus Hodarchaeales archaeon]|jgi:hypothetical protein